jgi:outer membrane lipoprotein carrier protein
MESSSYTFAMSRTRLVAATILLALCARTAGRADTTPQAAPIVRALEAHYHDAKTLKAIFLERYQAGRNGLQVESGTVYFSRPGRMRWEYESPERKLFLVDGKTVWFFVPADHTATRAPIKESTDWRTPLALLTGKAKLSNLCDRIDLATDLPGEAGHVVLRCRPKGEAKKSAATPSPPGGGDLGLASPDQPFDEVLLEVDPTTGELADVRILQPGGIELDYRFGNWVENPPLNDALFHFQAPAGVAIVDDSTSLP